MKLSTLFTGKARLAVLVLILAVAAGGAYLALRGRGQQVGYVTQPVTRGDLTSTVTSSGTLYPLVTVTVSTPVSGIIKALYADFNSQVKQGQVIAQIDPATFKADADEAHGGYLNAKANVDKAQATLEDANRSMRRYAQLVQDGSISQSEYDNATTSAATAKASLAAAKASVEQYRGTYNKAKTNLEYTTIISPVNGTVISRSVEVGQTVAASYQAPTLFTIAQDLTKMQINATMDESDMGKIQEGGNATFSVDAYPDTLFPATITQIRNSYTTTSNVVTYSVMLGVDNKELKLRPGMTANVTYIIGERRNVLKIPTAALRYHPQSASQPASAGQSGQSGQAGQKNQPAQKLAPGQKRIYVLQNGRPVPVVVTLGMGNDKETEVLQGDLTEGMEVITAEQTGVKAKTSTNPMMGGGMGPPPR